MFTLQSKCSYYKANDWNCEKFNDKTSNGDTFISLRLCANANANELMCEVWYTIFTHTTSQTHTIPYVYKSGPFRLSNIFYYVSVMNSDCGDKIIFDLSFNFNDDQCHVEKPKTEDFSSTSDSEEEEVIETKTLMHTLYDDIQDICIFIATYGTLSAKNKREQLLTYIGKMSAYEEKEKTYLNKLIQELKYYDSKQPIYICGDILKAEVKFAKNCVLLKKIQQVKGKLTAFMTTLNTSYQFSGVKELGDPSDI